MEVPESRQAMTPDTSGTAQDAEYEWDTAGKRGRRKHCYHCGKVNGAHFGLCLDCYYVLGAEADPVYGREFVEMLRAREHE